MNIRQLSIFDILDRSDSNKEIQLILKCEEDRILNAVSKSIDYFIQLPKNLSYTLSFSGGKDSHVLLGLYILYLKLGYEPLDIIVNFADTNLELNDLLKIVFLAQKHCESLKIPFEIVKSDLSYWYIQFVWGYPIPTHFNRWCTGKLKVIPMMKNKDRKPITGRHYGESTKRNKTLSKQCSLDSCAIDRIPKTYEPIVHWDNCLIWDALYYLDSILYDRCFDLLSEQYEVHSATKSGNLRMGCFMCPVVSIKTIESNNLDPEALEIRYLLEDLRSCRRILSPKTNKKGAIYIGDRRKYWKILNKEYLLKNNWISHLDILSIDDALKSDYSYPKTYKKEWIDLQHNLLQSTNK